jgi:hypothetical protein
MLQWLQFRQEAYSKLTATAIAATPAKPATAAAAAAAAQQQHGQQ